MVRFLLKHIRNSSPLTHTTIGFYHRGDPTDLHSIETAFRSLGLFQSQCDRTFTPQDGGPLGPPRVENINKYGGWNMNPANVFWTNGECKCRSTTKEYDIV